MMRLSPQFLLSVVFAVLASGPLSGSARADLVVGDGAAMTLGQGTLRMGCRGIRVAGTLHGSSGLIELAGDYAIEAGGRLYGDGATFEVAGDWAVQGSFDPGGSTVHFVDGCGRDTGQVCNSSTFANLILESDSAKTYEFEAGATQIVLDSLAISGADGALVQIRSKSAGDRAFIDLRGENEVRFVDVQDQEAVGRRIGFGSPEDLGSVDRGNTQNWFIDFDAESVPATEMPALIFALFLMLLLAGRNLRRATER